MYPKLVVDPRKYRYISDITVELCIDKVDKKMDYEMQITPTIYSDLVLKNFFKYGYVNALDTKYSLNPYKLYIQPLISMSFEITWSELLEHIEEVAAQVDEVISKTLVETILIIKKDKK